LKGRAVVENPTDHGERFYSLSLVSETTRFPNFAKKFCEGCRPSSPDRQGRLEG
jgi:hypothetical protein